MKIGRPRKLDESLEHLVKIRVTIARTSKLIHEGDIATGFSLSTATLRRYYFPVERALSLKVSKAAYEQSKSGDRTLCEDCHEPHTGHLKCLSCGILLHDDPMFCRCGAQHGQTLDGEHCLSCVIIT